MSTRRPRTRQRVRRAILIITLLLFPLIYNFMSPYIIIDGASQGIINGSFLVFAGLFLSSLFLGRAWCGWVCSAGAIGDVLITVRDRRAAGGRWDWIKWGIWIPWMGLIAFVAIRAGGYHAVRPLHLIEEVFTFQPSDRPMLIYFMIYYAVVTLVVTLALTTGRRGFCHYSCWMAPFMIIGRKARNLLAWPALRLRAESEKCTQCQSCTKSCPMSLAVQQMVAAKKMEDAECILCGSCVDTCPQSVIHYTFSAGRE